jgi:hypothetical protein
MSTKSRKTLNTLFAIVIALYLSITLFVSVDLAGAAPITARVELQRACTVNDNIFTKLFSPCTEVDSRLPVDQPVIITFDKAKWEAELANAEAWLRAQSDHSRYEDGNEVSDIAWRNYCQAATGEPKYTVTGEPVCPAK